MSNHFTPEGKDPQIWQLARRRASFRKQFATYVIVNAFFWAIWFFSEDHSQGIGFPWPVWPMIGWGIGIAFSWYGAYGGGANNDPVESEYEKLQRNRK
jgi:hypothetical protein